jgi:hypothetical protein
VVGFWRSSWFALVFLSAVYFFILSVAEGLGAP